MNVSQSYSIYRTFMFERTNKRRKVCIEPIKPDYDNTIVDEPPIIDIIDLTQDTDTDTDTDKQMKQITVSYNNKTTNTTNTPPTIWKKVRGETKKKHMEIARKIRYEELIELCGCHQKLLKIIKLLDCKQYVNVGENDILLQDSKNPNIIICKPINHGEPIKQLFI